MAESPACTCIKRTMPTKFGDARIVQVFDPFCQIEAHKTRGTSLLDPTYGKEASG